MMKRHAVYFKDQQGEWHMEEAFDTIAEAERCQSFIVEICDGQVETKIHSLLECGAV